MYLYHNIRIDICSNDTLYTRCCSRVIIAIPWHYTEQQDIIRNPPAVKKRRNSSKQKSFIWNFFTCELLDGIMRKTTIFALKALPLIQATWMFWSLSWLLSWKSLLACLLMLVCIDPTWNLFMNYGQRKEEGQLSVPQCHRIASKISFAFTNWTTIMHDLKEGKQISLTHSQMFGRCFADNCNYITSQIIS